MERCMIGVLFGKSPTVSDELLNEKGATVSHQFNNGEE